MKLGINWQENSTKRGAVWVITFIAGIIMSFLGKDVTQLLVVASGVAGGLGVALKDKHDDA